MPPTPISHPEIGESQLGDETVCRNQIVDVPQIDRWQVYSRLQELQISCNCPSDGTLRVEVDHAIAILLVRSTVQQFTAPRQELVNWLERCLQV
ncbi:MAG: hypothetical protein MUF49_23720 [Oculatellaceae cyanobacterium Prado106]|jgi:hypothetical protein|nr:hypothetical protein [Oculatellaceae cyanobacterium Prado106]